MRKEFVRILIPPPQRPENKQVNFKPAENIAKHGSSSIFNRVICTILLVLIGFTLHHEYKLQRLSDLEKQVELLTARLDSNTNQQQQETNSPVAVDGRAKRQAENYGPEVPRTEDGVPILGQSYFQRGLGVRSFPPRDVGPEFFRQGVRVDGGTPNNDPIGTTFQSQTNFQRRGIQLKSLRRGGEGDNYSDSEESSLDEETSVSHGSFMHSGSGRGAEQTVMNNRNYDDFDTNSFNSGNRRGSTSSSRSSYSSRSSSSDTGSGTSGCTTCVVIGESGRATYQAPGIRSSIRVSAVTPSTTTTSPPYVLPTTSQPSRQSDYSYGGRNYESRRTYHSAGELNIGSSAGRNQEPDIARVLQIPHGVLRTSAIDLDLGRTSSGRRGGCATNTDTQTSNSRTTGSSDHSGSTSDGPCVQTQSYNYTYEREYSGTPQNVTSHVREYSSNNPGLNFNNFTSGGVSYPENVDQQGQSQTQTDTTRTGYRTEYQQPEYVDQRGHYGQSQTHTSTGYRAEQQRPEYVDQRVQAQSETQARGGGSYHTEYQQPSRVVSGGASRTSSSSSSTRTRNYQTIEAEEAEESRYPRPIPYAPQDNRQYTRSRTSCNGPKPLAAHYIAETTSASNTRTRNSNAKGIFDTWKAADWITDNTFGDDSSNFVLSSTGILAVRKAGLYYIYAQIHYEEQSHLNGFTIEINSEPVLQCTRMTSDYASSERKTLKSNSCFTAGVHFIKENDQITIKDMELGRYSVLNSQKSFFGLMNIGGSCQ